MAACVADRVDVASCLLRAAGPSRAPGMVAAANRYGQSSVHIAARKGSQRLLRLLVAASAAAGKGGGDEGGGAAGVGGCSVAALLDRPDSSGDRPADIARRSGHSVALAEFARAVSTA